MKKADAKKETDFWHRGVSNLCSHQSVTLDLKMLTSVVGCGINAAIINN